MTTTIHDRQNQPNILQQYFAPLSGAKKIKKIRSITFMIWWDGIFSK